MAWRAEVGERVAELLTASPHTRVILLAPPGRLAPPANAVPGARRRSLANFVARDASPGASVLGQAEAVDAVVVWLVGTSMPPAARRTVLAEVQRALPPRGAVVVIDHNRPRAWWRRVRNAAWCVRCGVDPVRRAAYPVAREVHAAGFDEIALRLAFGEQIQIVRGVRPAPGGVIADAASERGRARSGAP
jgi:hypothetical protein